MPDRQTARSHSHVYFVVTGRFSAFVQRWRLDPVKSPSRASESIPHLESVIALILTPRTASVKSEAGAASILQLLSILVWVVVYATRTRPTRTRVCFAPPHCFYLTASSASFESNVRQQTPATTTMLSIGPALSFCAIIFAL